jgi:ParB family transcriptional regulator, chromosome partitioning protein
MSRRQIRLDQNPLLAGPSLRDRGKSGSPYRELQLSEIDIDPDQPRRVFDTERLEELAASIKTHGVLTPILVRPLGAGTYRLVAGERRYRAAKLAGLDTIPAVIDTSDDEGVVLQKQLVENLQRSDLLPLERAIAFGQLRDRFSWSVREIARQLGVSKSFVQRSLELLELPDDLQAALSDGASESKVLLLAQLPTTAARAKYLADLANWSRQQLESELLRILNKEEGSAAEKSGPAKRKRISPEDSRIVTELQQALGTRVLLLRRAGKKGQGKLSLEFYSEEDLHEIYRRLINSSSETN